MSSDQNSDVPIERRAQMLRHFLRQKKNPEKRRHAKLIEFKKISSDIRVKIMNKMSPTEFVRAIRCSRTIYITASEQYRKIYIHGLLKDKMSCLHPCIVFRIYNFQDKPESVQVEYMLQHDVQVGDASSSRQSKKTERKSASIMQIEISYFVFNHIYAMDLSYFYYPEICVDLEIHGGNIHKDFIVPVAKLIKHLTIFGIRCEKLSFRETIPEIRREIVTRSNERQQEPPAPVAVDEQNSTKVGGKLQALELYDKVVEAFLPRILRLDLGPNYQLDSQLTTTGIQRLNSLSLKLTNSENLDFDLSYVMKVILPSVNYMDLTIYGEGGKFPDGVYSADVIWPKVAEVAAKLAADPQRFLNREMHLTLESMDLPYSAARLFSKIPDCTVHELTTWGNVTLIIMPFLSVGPLVVVIQPSHSVKQGKVKDDWAQCHWQAMNSWSEFCDFIQCFSNCGDNLIDKQKTRFDRIRTKYFLSE